MPVKQPSVTNRGLACQSQTRVSPVASGGPESAWKKGKHKRLGGSENGCLHRRAEHINQVWSYDFVTDQTEDGRRLKLLVVLD